MHSKMQFKQQKMVISPRSISSDSGEKVQKVECLDNVSVRAWIWCFDLAHDPCSIGWAFTLVIVMVGGTFPLEPDRVSSYRWLPPLELWWTSFESLDLGSSVWCNDCWVFYYSLEVGLEL
jgi:hypothetical protein